MVAAPLVARALELRGLTHQVAERTRGIAEAGTPFPPRVLRALGPQVLCNRSEGLTGLLAADVGLRGRCDRNDREKGGGRNHCGACRLKV